MAGPLVIVESPAKARTISQFLGDEYTVESSVGHIRDLESKGLGVDVENGFKPTYVVNSGKKDVLRNLRSALSNADEVFLATDEDREGEAISWHLLEELNPRVPVKRMVFHEITRSAIDHAVDNWRDIDYGMVDAQEARRIVDRLFGYPVSGVLWRKVSGGLSAGRVQSPAVRLVVERERERMAFVAAEHWDLEASFATDPGFAATLIGVDGDKVATGKDFDATGTVTTDGARVLDEDAARRLAGDLDAATFSVTGVEEKPFRSSPRAPFMTSTLQQEGGRKLRMGSAQVMRVAQGLYERGYITYMRTDSTTLSEAALSAARSQVSELYGGDYLPDQPRRYQGRVKNAQEAHEAIRPSGEQFRTPESLRRELRGDDLALYDLIWTRTVASQMTDARGQSVQVRLAATSSAGAETTWAASGRTITFPGYLRAYVEGSDDPAAELEDRESVLPPLSEDDRLTAGEIEAKGHRTTPPARYTEASLVKRMEELGIGRPSTYASIMSTIQDRGYVWRKGSALVPSWTAFAVVNLLEAHFSDLVDYSYTARMEDELDQIAAREVDREPWLSGFWFGNGSAGLKDLVDEGLEEIDAAAINTIPIGLDESGVEVIVKPGRYGPYVKRGEETASVPEDIPPDEMTLERAVELLEAPRGDTVLGTDPETGLDVLAKQGRFGPYVQLGRPEDTGDEKPRTSSLFASMTLDDLSYDQAVMLLSLPRLVGTDPADGVEVTAQNGRYGPYLRKGRETRSLESESQIFEIDLDGALAILAQPKRGRGGAKAAPLRTLGTDPVSGREVSLRNGRFGPYVTDGEVNASLRTGDATETVDIDRATELLQTRRERGAAKKSPKKKSSKKKSSKKSSSTNASKKQAAAKKQAGTKKKAGSKKQSGSKKQAGSKKRPATTRKAARKGSGPGGASTGRSSSA